MFSNVPASQYPREKTGQCEVAKKDDATRGENTILLLLSLSPYDYYLFKYSRDYWVDNDLKYTIPYLADHH